MSMMFLYSFLVLVVVHVAAPCYRLPMGKGASLRTIDGDTVGLPTEVLRSLPTEMFQIHLRILGIDTPEKRV